jgi:hypothetical protein
MKTRGGKAFVYGDPFVTGGGTPAWNPAALSPLVWLDSADAATITLSGSNVTSWADKGSWGSAWAQANSSLQPTYSASDLGYPGVRFSANDVGGYNKLSRDRYDAPSAVEFVIVRRLDIDPTGGFRSGCWKLGTSGLLSHAPYTNGLIYDDTGSTVRFGTLTHLIDFSAKNCVYSVISTASEWAMSEDWTQRYTTATNTVSMPTTLEIGASDIYGMTGVVREVLIFGAKLSSTNRANLRAYLSSKWGTP